MFVLGVAGFMHDYNCALIDLKNKRVSICEAERISRRKHHTITEDEDLKIPISVCCKDLGCKIKDIDVIVFGHTDKFMCKERFQKIFQKKKFIEVDHHLSHAAAGYYSSPFEKSAVVSVDGFGDGSSGLIAIGEGAQLHEVTRISEVNSIGLEYLRATIHLGLGGYGSEGKTQGLAPYGDPVLYEKYMNEIEILPNGDIRLSDLLKGEGERLALEGNYLNSELLYNKFLNDYCPRRIDPEPMNEIHFNLAASIQKVLEKVMIDMSTIAKNKADSSNLVLSGGVSLNSSANGKLLETRSFDNIFALPQASDRGLGLGAALYYIHNTLKIPRFYKLENVFYGQEFTDKEASKAMKKGRLKIEKVSDITDCAAEALADGKIVGWFQGRSEIGARALGHRSILADPRSGEMKDVINEKVKHREWFRPFAPAVLLNNVDEYYEIVPSQTDLSLMTFTVKTKPLGAKHSPATTHVDGSARIQTVDMVRNKEYAQVIGKFHQITGVPIVLNTSFNDNGEPIVESPSDAVKTFLNSQMDVLCIGNILGRKE